MLGLLASIRLTAEEELRLRDDAAKLLEDLEDIELVIAEDTAIDVVDERAEETVTEEIELEDRDDDDGVTLPQGAPVIAGTSALAAPLVPWNPNSTVWFG